VGRVGAAAACHARTGAAARPHPGGHAGRAGRAAVNDGDVAETCTGTSATCPTDTFQPSGTPCTDDGNVCTADVCSGSSATCTHPAGNAGTVCRVAVNECDLAETCPGAVTIGFRGAASASSGSAASATSLAISRPAGTLANDVMVATISSRTGSGTPTITPPAGWTLIVNTPGSGLAVSTYWKLAGTAAADPGPYT